MYRIKRVITGAILLGSVFFSACGQSKPEYKSPAGYNLTQPEEFFLSDLLHEISGIAFQEGKSATVFAIEDETGTLYSFIPGDSELNEAKFGKKGDYEGFAISNGMVAVLRSDGKLFTFPFEERNQEEITNVQEWEHLIPEEEYESLAAVSKDSLLVVLCKECAVDKKADQTTGYILKLSDKGELSSVEDFRIESAQIDSLADLKGKNFQPSALTKNEQTGDWYILSSINKMLVVADEDWQIRAVYPLDGRLFNQPEGIAFDEQAHLFISNEGDDVTKKGSLLKFTRNQ